MRDAHGGFILISALAVMALLASLVGGVLLLVRSAASDAVLAREDLTRDALTYAGLEIAGYQLFMLKRPPFDMVEQRIRLDGGTVTLSVQAENGKVDLNGADVELLARLWRQAGPGSLTPEAFASRVIDWRDKDDAPGSSGAERGDYAAAGVEGAPPNAPFGMVDDLQHVLGVNARQVLALKPFLTVHNPTGKVSLMTAPPEVLRLLPGSNEATANRIVAIRRTAGASAARQIAASLGGSSGDIRLDFGTAFQVQITTGAAARRKSSRFIIVRAPDSLRPYYVTEFSSTP